jgi:hypothetical protein
MPGAGEVAAAVWERAPKLSIWIAILENFANPQKARNFRA